VLRAIQHDCRVLDRMFPTLREFSRAFAESSPGGRVVEEDGVLAAIAPAIPDRSVLNCVVYEDVAALEASLDRVAAAYDEAGVRAWTVWVHESDERAARALEAAGSVFDGEPMAMGLDLGELDDTPGDGGVEVVEGPDPAEVGRVLAASYGWPEMAGAIDRVDGELRVYIARAGGSGAACVATYDHGDDCGVFMVGTVPDARGRGLCPALMRLALARGRAVSTLQATAMGRPVYARLGYRDMGRVTMWERRRPAAPSAA
jgi:ribosomal protein S18 acetylase RimI-like enzyme